MGKNFTLEFNVSKYDPKDTNAVVNNDNRKYKVSDKVVENIMNFARSYRVVDTTNAGKVEMMMN